MLLPQKAVMTCVFRLRIFCGFQRDTYQTLPEFLLYLRAGYFLAYSCMLTSSDGYGLSTRQRGFINGSVAGSIAAVTLQPLDLLKTRLQAQRILPEGSKTPLQLPVSLRLLITRIAQSGGARVLWSGTAPSLARGAIGPGIYFVTLEEVP